MTCKYGCCSTPYHRKRRARLACDRSRRKRARELSRKEISRISDES